MANPASPDGKDMLSFHYIVTVEAETQEQADEVIGSRLGTEDKDSEFDYGLDYTMAEPGPRYGLWEAI